MAEVTGRITVAPSPVPVRIARGAWKMRRLPLLPMFILAIFVFSGITAPWIAPHDPERGNIRARMAPRRILMPGATTRISP